MKALKGLEKFSGGWYKSNYSVCPCPFLRSVQDWVWYSGTLRYTQVYAGTLRYTKYTHVHSGTLRDTQLYSMKALRGLEKFSGGGWWWFESDYSVCPCPFLRPVQDWEISKRFRKV